MVEVPLKPENATWWDHHELTYWLWATLYNAEQYLSLSEESQVANAQMFEKDISLWAEDRDRLAELGKRTTLASYQFVTAMGVLIRVLDRSHLLFPSIAPAFDAAAHLREEGKRLRDQVEHAYGNDGYLNGGGRYKDEFVRAAAGAAADAVSTIIRDDGHWLGNRLCVERVVEELRAIEEESRSLMPPGDEPDR